MNMPYNILLKTGECWTELHEDQSMNPILYLDTCAQLDRTVEEQLHRLLTFYGYSTSLPIRIPMCDSEDTTVRRVEVIRQSRQCMSIGSLLCNEELIRVWMVRPTMNYATYVVKVSERMRNTVANNYV